MHISTKIFVTVSGLIHCLFFAMESLFFMDEQVYTRFRLDSVAEAEIVRLFAYNQGWYNLFLAIAAFVGAFLGHKLKPNVGNTLAMYACFSMLGAALVLIYSSPDMLRASIVQGLFPVLAIVTFFVLKKNANV